MPFRSFNSAARWRAGVLGHPNSAIRIIVP
jgi:hypothetical protein